MAYTRTQATTHLSNELGEIADEVGQVKTDSAAGFGPALDRALRKLGVGESGLATATVADADVEAYMALCEFYALQRMWRNLSVRGDVDGQSVIGPRSGVFYRVERLFHQAKEMCEALGYTVDSTAAWESGKLNLDYIEPESTGYTTA